VTKAQRAELLRLLRTGHPLPIARARLEISRRDIEAGGANLAEELAEAQETGQALLLSRAIELGLGGDGGLLRLALDRSGAPTPEVALARMSEMQLEAWAARLEPELRGRLRTALGISATERHGAIPDAVVRRVRDALGVDLREELR
jgi:hypothetical protein